MKSTGAIQYAPKYEPPEQEFKTRTGRTFRFHELTGAQQVQADSASGGKFEIVPSCRLSVGLISVDGMLFTPLSLKDPTGQILDRLSRLRGSELDELCVAFFSAFSPSGEELKNESEPEAES